MIVKKSYIKGQVQANPSKSHEQRLLLGAMLAQGVSQLNNIGNSDDVVAARKIIENFGARIIHKENSLIITGASEFNLTREIFCAESAFCARLFTPIACIINNDFTITGEKTLLTRKICDCFEIFSAMTCKFSHNDGKLPVKFFNSRLTPGIYNIKNPASSQLISGLLMAMPLLNDYSKLIIKNAVSIPYLLMTIECMEKFGVFVNYKISGNDFLVNFSGNQKYKILNANVEGDWSSAAFIIVASAINGKTEIKGLSKNSKQADAKILNLMNSTNINYRFDADVLKTETSDIKAFDFDATHCPDLVPALIIKALFANGNSIIKGAERLLHKESSRAIIMKTELEKCGITIQIENDRIHIPGGQKARSSTLNSHGDHRIAMALTILALNSDNNLKIENIDCVSKSYPDFYKDLIKLGAEIYE